MFSLLHFHPKEHWTCNRLVKRYVLTFLWINHVLQCCTVLYLLEFSIRINWFFLSQGSSDFNMLDKDVVSMDNCILAMPPRQSSEEFLEAYEVVLILDDRENFGFVWPYPTHISIIFVQTHQNFVLMIVTFLHRYSSRKVASKKVADNIGSQFKVPVEVSYKLTLIKFFVAYNPTYCFLSS